MAGHTEQDFETAIETGLVGHGGYTKRPPTSFDETLALFPDDVIGFLKDSQPARWGQLEALLKDKTAPTVLDSLIKEMAVMRCAPGGIQCCRHFHVLLVIPTSTPVNQGNGTGAALVTFGLEVFSQPVR